MERDSVQDVWDHLESEFGEDLRVVTRYDGMEFTTRMREDIRAQYSTGEDRAIIDSTIIAQLQLDDVRDIVKAGEAKATIRVFERAWLLIYPDPHSRKSGFLVSLQRDGADSFRAVEQTLEYLTEGISPSPS